MRCDTHTSPEENTTEKSEKEPVVHTSVYTGFRNS